MLLSVRSTPYGYLPTTRPRCTCGMAQDHDFGGRREGADPTAGAGRIALPRARVHGGMQKGPAVSQPNREATSALTGAYATRAAK